MFRDRLSDLQEWCHQSYRKPLIIRGCRQVGKSWLVNELGKEFEHYLAINFEKHRKIHQYFEQDLDISTILEKLALYFNIKIQPGQTLVFFDEIQACEGALKTLRYFKEELPELHVIAAGSLLDFALNKLGIAVGRVQFMHIYPLSFAEFLMVNNQRNLRTYLLKQEHDPVIHERLLEYLKQYMCLGGMPAVIEAWLSQKDYRLCQSIQDEIIESYQIDFHKYAKQHEIPHVETVFEKIPLLLGKKFVYANIDQDRRSESIKNALLLLEKAGIANFCYHTSAQNQPLGAEKNEKKFKVFYFDIGIAQRLLNLDITQWINHPLPLANQGAIAEQFVAQEFMAYSDFRKRSVLYYWHREAKNSNAEVDFIAIKDGQIIPVEVKSSARGQMKSIQMFLTTHKNSHIALKISESPFAKQNEFIEIPLYAMESWHLMHDFT